MDQNQLKDLLYRADAVRSGHFLRASGRHSNLYIQCAHLFENARSAQEVCALIAQHYAKSGVQLVLSAAIGGMLAGYEVSCQLGVRNMYAERRDQVLTLRRGFAFAPGTRVLIVEDMVSTGHSVRELIEIVRAVKWRLNILIIRCTARKWKTIRKPIARCASRTNPLTMYNRSSDYAAV